MGSDESEDGLLCLFCCSFFGELMGVCIGDGMEDDFLDDDFVFWSLVMLDKTLVKDLTIGGGTIG